VTHGRDRTPGTRGEDDQIPRNHAVGALTGATGLEPATSGVTGARVESARLLRCSHLQALPPMPEAVRAEALRGYTVDMSSFRALRPRSARNSRTRLIGPRSLSWQSAWIARASGTVRRRLGDPLRYPPREAEFIGDAPSVAKKVERQLAPLCLQARLCARISCDLRISVIGPGACGVRKLDPAQTKRPSNMRSRRQRADRLGRLDRRSRSCNWP